ncbi:protein translocase subunit SecF [Candidatus Dependentiae bacterium]|nr:protein translocase subunit SecF [Candidatus Dependentiae bacterium]
MLSTTTDSGKYRFDFLKYRYFWLVASILYFAVGVAAYIAKGGFSYHIDFTGGAQVQIAFEKSTDIADVRKAVSAGGWKDAIIQSIGASNRDFIITVSSQAPETEAQITSAITKHIPGNPMRVDNTQLVGAEAGKDTAHNAVVAVLISLVVLLLYIALRFEFRFGLGAIIALIHDILAVMVFILLAGEPISLHVLASILAVLGYSMNDTVVIFARIRENMIKYKGMSEYDIFNISVNQTLRRTLLTSVATALSVLAIVILGGETLRGLSVVMLAGIIIGTYSSIYIASSATLVIKPKN